MSRRIVILFVAAALALPAAAHAGSPVLTVVDLPAGGARSPAAARAVRPFTMVALHWRGPGGITFRTRSPDGRWSGWHDAAPEAEDAPDPGSSELAGTRGWHVGNPYWTGVADRLETRARGRVERVRAYTIWSVAAATGAARQPARSLALAGSPLVLDRAAWGANELLERPPAFAPNVRFAVVHHTAGSNAYTRQQSAAIVRGIQLYHMSGNGWNDIGYNFLVDKYGQVFEGRAGGVDRPVVGAHAEGFNAGSVGIAVLGSYGATGISAAARAAIVQLLAWRLDAAHVDPLATLSWASGGNARFPKGIPVFLRAIAGHRDTGFTDCPGDRLERDLDRIVATVAETGLPKIYEPRAAGKPGGPVRFTARLSDAGAWRLTVLDATGAKVATSRGTGATVDWTWDASAAPPGRYSWTLERAGALAAAGAIGRKPVIPTTPPTTPPTATVPPATAPLVTGFSLSPTVLSPNGDGSNDTATVTYTLTKGAFVSAFVLDQSGTVVAQTLFSDQKQSARLQSFTWAPDPLPDGRYRFVVAARLESGQQETAGQDVLVDRTLSLFGVAPVAISPNGDGVADAATLSFTLLRPALVTVRLIGGVGAVLATLFSGSLQAGPQQVVWDGSGPAGRLADGTYTAEVTVADGLGDLVQQVPVTVDTVAPVLTLVSGPEVRLSVSEAATVTILLDGQQTMIVAGPGEFRLPPTAPPTSLSAVATDAAGNVSATIAWP